MTMVNTQIEERVVFFEMKSEESSREVEGLKSLLKD